MWVKEGRKSKGLVVMTEIKIETSSYAKAGRLLPGLLLRESLSNLLKEEGK